MRHIFNNGIAAVFLGMFLVFSLVVFSDQASAYSFNENSGLIKTGDSAGYPAGDLSSGSENRLAEKVGYYISIVLSFVGVLFLGLTIYGGYRWMMANGNDSDVALAKKIITRALVGLVVVLSAYAITSFVSNSFKGDLIQQ